MKAFLTAKIDNAISNQNYYAQFSTTGDFSANNITSSPAQVDGFGLIKFSGDLNQNTKYFVRILQNDILTPIPSYVGRVLTPPTGQHSFKFGFASCSRSESNAEIYDILYGKSINRKIDFFVHLGDLHYSGISVNNEALFHQAYDSAFSQPRQYKLWGITPLYYMWDDHDYGPNDTDKNNPARSAAIAAYRRRAPYPLASNLSTTPPYFSFVRGRVRFIFTDIRSEREPKGTYPSTDSRQKVFSDTQKNWFFQQMLDAKDNNQVIIWVNTKPWVSSIQNGKDDWGGYHAARLEIVNFIETNDLTNRILIISGDMHALAYDNGSSVNNYGNLKVCHAAPLDQLISTKGGPYTIGPITQDSGTGSAMQYGIIEIFDTDPINIIINFKGIAVDQINFSESTVINQSFSLYNGNVVTASITFRVNMTEQVRLGNFTPGVDFITVAGNFNNFDQYENDMVLVSTPNSYIYEKTIEITTLPGNTNYRFSIINGVNFTEIIETNLNTFQMTNNNQVLSTQFFNDIPFIASVIPPYPNVDISNPCYTQRINNDSFCKDVEWDITCQEFYDICLSSSST